MKLITAIFVTVAFSLVSCDDDYEIFTMDQSDEISTNNIPHSTANESSEIVVDSIPYVSLRIDGQHFGTGVIIASEFILTPWSILRFKPRQNVTIVARLGFEEVPSLTFSIRDVKSHFDFEVRPPANGVTRPIHDIAVVRINGTFNIDPDRIANVTMVKQGYKTPIGDTVELMGFASNEVPGEEDLQVLHENVCKKWYMNQGGLSNGEFCAMADKKLMPPANLCTGDEGSPLLYRGSLIGIATWVNNCGLNETTPAVFTPIGRYRRWINFAMKEMLGQQAHGRLCKIGDTEETIAFMYCKMGCEERNEGEGECDYISRCICRSNSGIRSYYDLKYKTY